MTAAAAVATTTAAVARVTVRMDGMEGWMDGWERLLLCECVRVWVESGCGEGVVTSLSRDLCVVLPPGRLETFLLSK